MIEFLDLQSVHWPSALFGVVLLFTLGYAVVLVAVVVSRVRIWFAAQGAPQDTPVVEEVRTFDPGQVTLPRGRRPREAGTYWPVAPQVPSARHSTILGPDESYALWMQVTGGRDTI